MIVDIHSHVIPGVDDGSQSLEDSLDMVDMAARSGVKYLVATPHCNIPDLYRNYKSKFLIDRFMTLKRAVEEEQIPIRLIAGAELYATERLPELLKKGQVWTINRTRYILIECAFDEDPRFMEFIMDRCRKEGFFPVIAHPERYFFVQDDPSIALNWYRKGYGIQINKGSILGAFGKPPQKTAGLLIRHNIVTCVASDAHGLSHRTTDMEALKYFMEQHYGEAKTKLLMEQNPLRILAEKPLLFPEPLSIEE